MFELFASDEQIQRVSDGEKVQRPSTIRALIPVRFLDVDSTSVSLLADILAPRHLADPFQSRDSFLRPVKPVSPGRLPPRPRLEPHHTTMSISRRLS